jgi:hypothetical protein
VILSNLEHSAEGFSPAASRSGGNRCRGDVLDY